MMRTVLFLYTPATNAKITGAASDVLYPHFFYTVPETLTPLVVLHLLLPDGLLAGLRQAFCWCCARKARTAGN